MSGQTGNFDNEKDVHVALILLFFLVIGVMGMDRFKNQKPKNEISVPKYGPDFKLKRKVFCWFIFLLTMSVSICFSNRTPSYYQVLNVTTQSNAKEIGKSFRDLSKKYHPDHGTPDFEAEEKYNLIRNAKETLTNKEKKKAYDRLGPSITQCDTCKKYNEYLTYRVSRHAVVYLMFFIGAISTTQGLVLSMARPTLIYVFSIIFIFDCVVSFLEDIDVQGLTNRVGMPPYEIVNVSHIVLLYFGFIAPLFYLFLNYDNRTDREILLDVEKLLRIQQSKTEQKTKSD